MPEITLNGQNITAAPGATVLETARSNGVFIPTLCHHPGLKAYGACRLCLVEVRAGFRPGLTSSCVLPVMDGLEVETDSETVKEGRRLVVRLLLDRAPGAKEIQVLAQSLGLTGTGQADGEERCILCGRCVRACQSLGVNAIAFAFRGANRRVTVPFDRTSDQCLACQACLTVCPTGAITALVTPAAVEMVEFHTRREFLPCPSCGRPYVPVEQQNHIQHLTPPEQHRLSSLCPSCRRKDAAGILGTWT